MESVRQSCRPKHQVLTLKCYPRYQKGVQEVKPNSSELSYLLYYVSTRRSKLTKVGAFLEKRAARDVWRRRLGNVQVTLQILAALIEKLPRDLLIYARSVLTVIETVLQSNEISMVEDSIATFEIFCRHQDMVALAAEQEIANQYREVVRTYASFADANPSAFSKVPRSPPVTLRWRNAGLRAIKGVVSSEGLAADGGESLRIVLPVVLENLYTGEDDVLEHLQARLQEPETNEPDQARRRRVSVATVDTTNGDVALASQTAADVDMKAEMDVRLIALRCLERVVVSGSNRGQIRIATTVVLRFILSKDPIQAKDNEKNEEKDTSENWATSLIELIAKWCPVQVRFVILVTAMELLMEIHPTEKVLEKPFTIVYLVDWLLKSQVNMIGLSIMDVLLGLMHYISLVVLPEAKGTPESGTSEKQDALNHEPVLSCQRKRLLSLLQTCIGNLTTHIYYGDQVVDLVKALLSRFKPPGTHETLPTHPSGGQSENPASAPNSETNNNGFSHVAAKVSALKAIKNIFIVANLRRPIASVGVESRDHIGIDVWDGTQWLLRASEREVCYAYADAFLSWLKFETDKMDLKFKDENRKHSTCMVKREPRENGGYPVKRSASSPVGQREQATLVTQSNFLRLFHLTVYDMALEHAGEASEVLLLHLLLTNLIESLGVNAIRFGLPMILRLQDDVATVDFQRSLTAKVNIGSFCYGYLQALSEKFHLEVFKVGSEIGQEIERRKKLGLWLQGIRLPPVSLDRIVPGDETSINGENLGDRSQLRPFRSSIQELVDRIEDAYNTSATSPAQSPPSSPNRSYGIPPFGQAMSASNDQNSLPPAIKEQMLSPWSREACLAAAEQGSAKAMSLSGSRVGTTVMRNQVQVNGESSPSTSNTPVYAHQGDAAAMGASAAAPPHFRRDSVPESLGTPVGSSNRGSPVRVNELRRVLSVNNDGQKRRLSPLRSRLDASSGSIISSSSESVFSGNFSVSDQDEDGTSLRRQSTRGGQSVVNDDGMDTPRASTAVLGNGSLQEQPRPVRREDANGIPPVPPLPPNLSIPGCFPNDSQRSLSSSDRPTSAPGGGKRSYVNGKTGALPTSDNTTLDKRKSRSITGLAAEAGIEDPAMLRYLGAYGNGDAAMETRDDGDRRDIEKLLNGFLSPDNGGLSNVESLSTMQRDQRRHLGRRGITGGIGRPPY